MHEQPKNRDWVKNAAIIFLAVLLVLTFFSNTIMNRSLPEVATQDVTSGSIVARVRGTGTVTANTNSQVKMEKTRVIRSVLVKVGQQVEPGDVLFTLGEGSSEDIDAAEEALRQLQASYNTTAAGAIDHNYSSDNRKIANLEEKMNEAAANLAIAKQAVSSSDTTIAQRVADVEAQLEKAMKARDDAKKEYDSARGAIDSETNRTIDDFVTINANDLTFTPLSDLLKKEKANDTISVQELDNLQAAIVRILVSNDMLDGDLLNDSYGDRSKIDIQIDRVQALIDGITYRITFKNNGEDLQSSLVAYGTVPSYYGNTPTKESDSTYTYEFKGWTPPIAMVTGEAVYTAEFTAIPITPSPSPDGSGSSDTTTGDITININTDNVTINTGTGTGAEETPPTLTATNSSGESENNNNEENESEVDNGNSPVTEEVSSDIVAAAFSTATTSTSTETPDTQDANIETVKPQEDNDSENQDPPVSPLTGEKNRQQLEEWLSALEKALELYDEAESYKYYKEQIVNQKKALYEAAEAEAQHWSDILDQYLSYGGTAESAVYKSKLEAYKTAEDAYLTAVENLRDKKATDQASDASRNAGLASTWQQIEKAKQKLADLTGGEEAQILAKTSGVVQTIECAPGDTKQKDDILCTLELPNMGYNLSFSVTNDQAARLRPGDTATVSNFYWGTEITATLNNIKVDPKNPQTNKLLTFDLSGNVTAGSELTLSVGQKSANYDIIIPSSAIRTDANGSFVLKVESKNSPLGNRYIARRVPVEVLASDDSNSAVSADLGFGDYVITTSSAPVKNGELVRLATS